MQIGYFDISLIKILGSVKNLFVLNYDVITVWFAVYVYCLAYVVEARDHPISAIFSALAGVVSGKFIIKSIVRFIKSSRNRHSNLDS